MPSERICMTSAHERIWVSWPAGYNGLMAKFLPVSNSKIFETRSRIFSSTTMNPATSPSPWPFWRKLFCASSQPNECQSSSHRTQALCKQSPNFISFQFMISSFCQSLSNLLAVVIKDNPWISFCFWFMIFFIWSNPPWAPIIRHNFWNSISVHDFPHQAHTQGIV